MSYSLKISFNDKGEPVLESATGKLPPAGHVLIVSGQYNQPMLNDHGDVVGVVTLSVQHFDGGGEHVVSSYQYHDRAVQGPTASDGKIVDMLRRNMRAIKDAEVGYKARPGAPLPSVGPEAPQDGSPTGAQQYFSGRAEESPEYRTALGQARDNL
jgi:hypothetical protein